MELQSNTEYQDIQFRSEVYAEQEFNKVSFEHCHFINCDLSSSHLKSCSFEDCIFENCNLSTLHVDDCTFRDTSFTSSKLIGILWHECRQRGFSLGIKFKDSSLNYSSFYGLDLQKCTFDTVSAIEVDFTEANLSKRVLHNMNLSGATFSRTNLKGTDFTTATNYLLNPAENTVKGAIFSMPEAMNLLYTFGVKIQM